MKKIKTIFLKDSIDHMTDIPDPELAWVFAGEGTPHCKLDGTSCMFKNEVLYKRFDRKLDKKGNRKEAPNIWIPCQPEPDPITNHWPGWTPVTNHPCDKWHREAFNNTIDHSDGTYELIGPKIQTNAANILNHHLVKHTETAIIPVEYPITYLSMSLFMCKYKHEGIVFHRNNATQDMAKIRRSDFGLQWPIKNN